MRSKYLFVTIFAASILVVLLARFTTSSLPDGSVPDPMVSQPTSPADGSSLLDAHCSRCHDVHRIEQVEKSREEWQEVLSRMKGLGVFLNETEEIVLLDYLAKGE